MNFQCAVYFIIIYTIVHSDATDVQTIQIPINNPNQDYLVQLQKPLKIVFEGTYDISWCVYENIGSNKELIIYSDRSTGSSWLTIESVTKDMSTQWKCMKKDKTMIIFNIRVKGAYAVEVNLVGTIISFSMTNQSVKEYDAIYNYACEVGDTIDITCKNLYEDGHIILQYHDAQGAHITYGRSYEKENFGLTFRMLVRSKNVSRSYVDCTYVTPMNPIEQQFTYRTMFQITNRNPRRSDGFIITINGMKLTGLPIGLMPKDRYVYKFFSMEHLNLTCSKSREQLDAVYGNIINGNNKTVFITDVVRTAQTLTTLFEPVNLDNVTYQCYSKKVSLLSEITFIREPNRDTYILGLSASNVLYEYNTDKWNWTIHYQYTVNQILNLTCITTMDRTPQWANRKEIISTIHKNDTYETKYINYMFPMNIETLKTISCESVKNGTITQRVTIILHQVLDIPAGEQVKSFPVFEIIGTIAGILFATIGAVCALYLWKNKRNILTKLHTCLKKDDNQLHSLTNEVVNEYTCIENEYNYIQNQNVYMITNTAYCGSFENYVTQRTTSQSPPLHKENYYTEIVDKTTHNEISTTYAVPYETHHMNKNKVSNSGKDYENLKNKSNTGYSNLQITDCNVWYSNFSNDDSNAS